MEGIALIDKIISIHSARVGGDEIPHESSILPSSFQSTPPVWAETFNIHPCVYQR